MPIINVPLDVPDDIFAGITAGELTRYGGVVRNHAGATLVHLKDGLSSAETQRAVSKGAATVRKSSKVTAVGLGVAAAAVGVAVLAAATRVKKQGSPQGAELEMPICIQRFTVSLRAYLDAARDGRLGEKDVERLVSDLDAVESEFDSGRIAVDFSIGQWKALVQLVADYTRRLAEANRVETSDLRELAHLPDGDVVLDLRRHLELQKQIFKNAA
ncbi:hypothetical protein KBX06_27100 [Micromonospora sp. C31]|uniref:hypothetical protein n=1 Tax=Micromonospora sp. C31 TaxID=2824876 RepID=UPI001B38B079|nr:hypothetical protein [Micromonospora sp. C31]MBQ1076788.1 hypothetical protein [Micromonospora sp. C31]